ncbi:TIGR02569 family protein [Glycomyces mayteni]|uniref:TIGR02569 family protein n=1 Tax=Glycomyces mayteni TaxID=543887 RepID=A0ABW2DDS2_9ACTN|nr:TIGR02569 family protein [Glycomyces mayteni]
MQPPRTVLEAFGSTAEPVLLEGGQGRTWRSGGLVLKPVDNPAEAEWRAETLSALPESDTFRIPRPIPTRTGEWTAEGWEATQLLPGRTDPKRWNDAIEVGAAFHRAIRDVSRPDFLDTRDDWWTLADRDSWNLDFTPDDPTLRDLAEARTPVAVAHQLTHGDLLGNILYEPGLPPAIIDWPPYWRPTSWAAAVAAVDALCWQAADESLLDHWTHLAAWPQMTLRALMYRMLTDHHAAAANNRPCQPHPAYLPIAEAVIRRAR